MKPISLCRSVVIFAGLCWAASVACAGPAQTPTSTKPDAATPPQAEAQSAPNTAKKKAVKSGVWHHFGERDNAPAAGQDRPGDSRRIDPNHAAPQVVPSESDPRHTAGTNRMADLERQMWALVNRDRQDPENSAETGSRAHPLKWNEKLAAVARAHSRDMLEQRYFDHVDRNGRTLSARINAAGIPWRALAENIAINQTVSDAEASFMNEPRFQQNHRGNILNANYTDVGIGIVQAPNGSLYITQDFATILPESSGRGAARY